MIGVLLASGVVAALLAWVAGAVLGALLRFAPAVTHNALLRQSGLRAAVVLVPPIVAVLILLEILVPSPILGCHCNTYGHHLHLCLHHPLLAHPLLGPSLVLATLWGLCSSVRLARVFRDIAEGERWAKRLRQLPFEQLEGAAFRLTENLGLSAFAVGILRPVIVVDRALWAALDRAGRRAVIHHEHAHALRHDALTWAVLRIASALTLWPFSERWLRAWRTATESVCDRHAAFRLGEAASVAETLVSVERLRSTQHCSTVFESAIGIAAGAELEDRVRSLLSVDEKQRAPLLNDLVIVGVALLSLSLLVLFLPGAAMHHSVESVLSHLIAQ